MKTIAQYGHSFGDGNGKAGATIGVEGENFKVMVEATYPMQKVLEPAFGVLDRLVDQLEALIPGDQKALAAGAKADARAALIKALSEPTAEPAPATASTDAELKTGNPSIQPPAAE